jgi:hypothetical protein
MEKNMKKIIALMTLLATVSAFAGTTTVSGSLRIKGASEADIIASAEAMIPSVLDGSNREMRTRTGGRCDFRARNMVLGSLTVKKFYVSSDDVSFEPAYAGILGFKVKNCRDDN